MKRSAVLAAVIAFGFALAACSSSSDTSTSDGADSSSTTTTAAADDSNGGGSDSGSVKDACAALPSETIQSITGKDPGQGELDQAGTSTSCSYYGDVTLVVEIDEGSDIESAQTSEEAYGFTCASIIDIGDKALFCSGFKGPGNVGEIIWTDGAHVFYVQYDEGDSEPTQDVPLQLAHALEA